MNKRTQKKTLEKEEKIDFRKIEEKWQKEWLAKKIFQINEKTKSKKGKYYVLDMFPYPSGAGLHMGHAFVFSLGDIFARFKRLQGYNVLYPIGYDSLGLPAENAAIKAGTHPSEYTKKSIENFMKQQKAMGWSYDWSRLVKTSDPEFYRWDQWIFLKMLEKGIAYRKKAPVNYCSKCDTVLANEQVVDGKCWRHEEVDVEIKHLEQWFFRITDYAEELLDGLEKLDWPENAKKLQRNWIGKSYGTEVDFEIEVGNSDSTKEKISNVVIVHGCPSNSNAEKAMNPKTRTYDKHWIPWLKKELEKNGIKTEVPLMPEPWKPDYKSWKKEFDKINVDENSILVGHSCGGGFLVRWLGETKKKIKKLILVAPWKIPEGDNFRRRFYDYNIDASIKSRIKEVIIFSSDNEEDDGKKSAKIFEQILSGKFIELKNRGHFIREDMGTDEFPELLNEIISTDRKNISWPVFTTRVDTIYGVTFMVVSAQHPRLMEIVTDKQKKEVEKYMKKLKSVSEKTKSDSQLDKEGVFTGSFAINPLTKEKVPVYAGNFVLPDYGSGMVMAVPAHDQRDYEFAVKYKLPIKQVIEPSDREFNLKDESKAFTGEGRLINSDKFNGIENKKAIHDITIHLEKLNLGKKKVQFKLRDWLVSRQRYWGTPIPIIYCEKCKENIEKNSLEINFYDNDSYNNILNQTKTVETRALNPHEKNRFFGNVKKGDYLKCVNKNTGSNIFLEILNIKKYKTLNELYEDKNAIKNIFPTKNITSFSDLENSYRYTNNYLEEIKKNGLVSWDIKLVNPGIIPLEEKDLPVKLPEKVVFGKGNPLKTNNSFVEVKCPKCKSKACRETDTMDTFVNSSWYFLRYTDPKNSKKIFDEAKANYWCPIDQYIGGPEHITMHLLYIRFYTKFLRDLGIIKFDEPALRYFTQGIVKGSDGEKMSKSRGNVVEPFEMINKYGADTLRLALVSFASPDKETTWDENVVVGSHKFLTKFYKYFDKKLSKNSDVRVESKLNKSIKEITLDIENFRHNQAVIKLRLLFDYFYDKEISRKDIESFLKMLHVYCPFITEEIWHKLGNKNFISLSQWPQYEENKINLQLEKEELMVEKLASDINNILKILESKGEKNKGRGIIYSIPSEVAIYKREEKNLEKKTNLKIEVRDIKEANQSEKKIKAVPGKPGILIE